MEHIEVILLNQRLYYQNQNILYKIKLDLKKRKKVLLTRIDDKLKNLLEQDLVEKFKLNSNQYWFNYVGEKKIIICPRVKGGILGDFNPKLIFNLSPVTLLVLSK